MKKVIVLGLVASLVTGCASSVNRINSFNGEQLRAENFRLEKGVNKVSLELDNKAKEQLVNNLKFNPETLRSTVNRALDARNIVRPEGEYTVEVVVTDIRVRSNFTAVAFGFFAGADSVTGTVTIADKDHKPIKSFQVSASYALGGLAGGADDARMNWLYEKFAEETLKELSLKN